MNKSELLYQTNDPNETPLVMPTWARSVPDLAARIDAGYELHRRGHEIAAERGIPVRCPIDHEACEPHFADIWVFIAAQLHKDELTAFDASDRRSGRWFVGDKWNVYGVEDETPHEDCETNELIVYGNMKAQSEHIACWDPARALLEVASKRRMLERHRRPRSPAEIPGGVSSECCIGCGFLGDDGIPARTPHIDLCPELRDLAAPYAERPGFKPAWRMQ